MYICMYKADEILVNPGPSSLLNFLAIPFIMIIENLLHLIDKFATDKSVVKSHALVKSQLTSQPYSQSLEWKSLI